MATAENLDREKHHFNPAENHYYSFNKHTAIQRDYLGSEFATPPHSAPASSFVESALAQSSVRRYETAWLIARRIFRNIVGQRGRNEATVRICGFISLINGDLVECEVNSGLLSLAGTKVYSISPTERSATRRCCFLH